MDLSSIPIEVTISLTAILIVSVLGCISGLHSWKRISDEKKRVKRAETILTGDEAWEDAYPHDRVKLATWLRTKGIKSDSHLGDFIRTSWSAWLGGRPASLTELHMLVARRERKYKLTRLSAGIAALLLVFGIVGTLFSIKPVLANFKFQIAQDNSSLIVDRNDQDAGQQEVGKDAASVEANTELVNTLIHDLGNAFWPSLAALLGTIAVVSCRGLYSVSLHDFTLELDRFAVDTLIPRYRVPSLSEQYQDVKATLANVAANLIQREGRFEQAVEKLEDLVEGISPALTGLEAAAAANKAASEALTSGASSITKGLTKYLGDKSVLVQAITSFESVFENTEKSLSHLSNVVTDIGKVNAANQNEIKSTLDSLAHYTDKIREDHHNNQAALSDYLDHFKRGLNDVPDHIASTSSRAVAAAMHLVTSSMAELTTEQRKWHIDSANDLKKATEEGLAGVVKAEKDLLTSASNIKEIKKEVDAAIMNVTAISKNEITSTAVTASSNISGVTEKMNQALNRLGYPNNDPSFNSELRGDLAPRNQAVSGKALMYGNETPDLIEPKNHNADHHQMDSSVFVSASETPVIVPESPNDQLSKQNEDSQSIKPKTKLNFGEVKPNVDPVTLRKKTSLWGKIFPGKKH